MRHGESVMNRDGIFSGRYETPLTQRGRSQTQRAANKLMDVPIDCIVASPMGRTMETAIIVANAIGYPTKSIIQNSFFIERSFGPLEGTAYKPNLGDVEGVETMKELLNRAKLGLAFLNTIEGESILLVSHGAIGRALRHCINPAIPYRPSRGFENGEIVQLI